MMDTSMISKLPEDCMSLILSHTSPTDVLQSSIVSKHFLSVSKSDTIWSHFLPSDYHHILSQSSTTLPNFDSKRDLFLYLCRSPILINDNTQVADIGLYQFNVQVEIFMVFWLITHGRKPLWPWGPGSLAWTNKRERNATHSVPRLSIVWGNGETPWYWSFEPISDSRFTVAAELNYVWWLEVKGRIHVKLLSPNTKYGAYLVFKMLSDYINHTGFENTPVKVTVLEIDEEDEGPPRNKNHEMVTRSFYVQPAKSEKTHLKRTQKVPKELPSDREDGWMEIEMGMYQIGDAGSVSERAVLEMTMWEVEA